MKANIDGILAAQIYAHCDNISADEAEHEAAEALEMAWNNRHTYKNVGNLGFIQKVTYPMKMLSAIVTVKGSDESRDFEFEGYDSEDINDLWNEAEQYIINIHKEIECGEQMAASLGIDDSVELEALKREIDDHNAEYDLEKPVEIEKPKAEIIGQGETDWVNKAMQYIYHIHKEAE